MRVAHLLTSGLPGIYETAARYYAGTVPNEATIRHDGSKGLTLNVTTVVPWKAGDRLPTSLSADTPLVFRNVRPRIDKKLRGIARNPLDFKGAWSELTLSSTISCCRAGRAFAHPFWSATPEGPAATALTAGVVLLQGLCFPKYHSINRTARPFRFHNALQA